MRASSVLLAGSAGLLSLAPARSAVAQSSPDGRPGPMPATVAVSAMGEEQLTPDRARLSIGVQTQAPTAAEASARNARLQRAVIDTLRALGVPAEQISTSGFNVYPEQQYDQQTRRARIVGYNVQNTVVVELRQTAQVGPALDAALAKGANLVSSLEFYSSQVEVARRRALAKAVENARADAEVMARAAGGRLGPLVEVTTGVVESPRPIPMMRMEGRAAAASAPDTPISGGTQTVSATASVRWVVVPAGAP